MKKPIIIGVIILAVSVPVFMFVILLNNETMFNMIQVNGTVKTNSTTIPRFIGFTDLGTKSVNVESGFYSITLPNNRSYEVVFIYDYKVPPAPPKYTGNTGAPSWSAEGQCVGGVFVLHVQSNHLEYNISCPKM